MSDVLFGVETVVASPYCCPGCGETFVERTSATTEQAWLGTWFDHPQVAKWSCDKIATTVLIPNAALLAQEAQLHDEHHAMSPTTATAYCRRVECPVVRSGDPS